LAPSLLQSPPVGKFDREDPEVASNAKAPNLMQVERFQTEIQTSEAVRAGQYNFLSEMVGLTFGLMTLCWIITAFCALA
jgi:hypothetical protein